MVVSCLSLQLARPHSCSLGRLDLVLSLPPCIQKRLQQTHFPLQAGVDKSNLMPQSKNAAIGDPLLPDCIRLGAFFARSLRDKICAEFSLGEPRFLCVMIH